MSNNGDVRDVTRVFNVTYKSRNIVNFALLEAHSLPKIGICLRIQAYVTLAILIPSKICQPNIISLVCQQRLGCGDRDLHQRLSSGVIGGLTTSQDEAERQSLIVAAGMDFARKAAA